LEERAVHFRKKNHAREETRGVGKDKFARLMTMAIRREGETAPIRYDPEQFCLVSKTAERVLYLADPFKTYQATPSWARHQVMKTFARGWVGRSKLEVPASFEDMKPNLLPQVRCRSFYETSRLGTQQRSESPFLRLGEHLGVSLVYDLPEVMRHIDRQDLMDRQVTFEEAFRVACDNLRARSHEELVGHGPGVWRSPWHDSYDAARLLLVDQVRRHPVRGDHVAMVPNRDTLLVTGSEDEVGLGIMLSLSERGFRQAYRVSGIALRLEGESWTPFLPPAGHPHFRGFKRLWQESRGQNHASQTEPLRAVYLDKGEDVFVAPYNIAEDAATKEPWTWCFWGEGLDTLLPCTDEVMFFRVNRDEMKVKLVARGKWQRVREIVGDLMEPLDLYPERYRVRRFPSVEQLASINEEDPDTLFKTPIPWCPPAGYTRD
jgi:hypothetical protein